MHKSWYKLLKLYNIYAIGFPSDFRWGFLNPSDRNLFFWNWSEIRRFSDRFQKWCFQSDLTATLGVGAGAGADVDADEVDGIDIDADVDGIGIENNTNPDSKTGIEKTNDDHTASTFSSELIDAGAEIITDDVVAAAENSEHPATAAAAAAAAAVIALMEKVAYLWWWWWNDDDKKQIKKFDLKMDIALN